MTSSAGRARIGVIADSRKPRALSPLTGDLVDGLEALGHPTAVVDPDCGPTSLSDLRSMADAYVLKGGSEAALSLAGALETTGVRVINPYSVAAACRDKIVQTAVLCRAGVPVPASWLTTDPTELADELPAGPLIVKDPRGSRGRGLHLAHTAADLAALPRERPWLVMRYHPPQGPDLKLYRIGAQVFGVLRRFPARTPAEKAGTLVEVTPQLHAIVLQCGEAFGIDLYGVDVIHAQGRPWVVDMSGFPGFKGVPDAARLLARHLSHAVEGSRLQYQGLP